MKRLVGAVALMATMFFVIVVILAIALSDDGTPADRTFSQELLLNVADSFFTALFTGLFVAGGAALAVWLVQRGAQERKEAQQLAQRCTRRAVQIAGRFYLETQRFWRKVDKPDDWGKVTEKDREAFDVAYAEFAHEAGVFEQELVSWYAWDSEVRQTWHQIKDLLTVRYFDLRKRPKESASDSLLRVNSKNYEGQRHSGLAKDELRKPTIVLRTYHQCLRDFHKALPTQRLTTPDPATSPAENRSVDEEGAPSGSATD